MPEAKFLQKLIDRPLTEDELKVIEEKGSLYPHIIAPKRPEKDKRVEAEQLKEVAV